MTGRTDRAWALPSSAWVMRMTWSELLFAHWAVEPNAVASLLPKGVDGFALPSGRFMTNLQAR